VRLSGRAATEAAVKAGAAGTRVLHLATHGFFLGARCAPTPDRVAHAEPAGEIDAGENPLLLAGFALSGANRRESAGPDDEDGILTAEEIAALDLRGVEWAVLSACDTGVGEVRAGEGVLGLRRAFQVAGARTVIMSLWPVDDENTRRWMTGVYERRFVRGAGTMEAVRESSLEQLRRRRTAGLSTHPFYWAGFIAAGQWR
jgi:CHAT domain-containing protein